MYRLRYALINAPDRRVRVFTRVTIVGRGRTYTYGYTYGHTYGGGGGTTNAETRVVRDCVPIRVRRDAYRVGEMHLHTRESVRDARKHNQGRAGQKH